MKATGIIVAMRKELSLLLPLIENRSTVTINGIDFHTGKLGGRDVIVLQSGIGKVNAAIATLTLIDSFHVGLIINTGVAGGTGRDTNILDVVVGDRIAYHDVWCGPGTREGEASGCPPFFENPFTADLKKMVPGVKFGLIASGDIFVSKVSDLERILALYPDAMAVDMESGAIAQVCYLKNVPFIAVRVISDTPGKADNISQYENFWEDAPRSTFDVLQRLLTTI